MYIADCLVYRFFASVLLRYYSSLSDRRDRISARASERDSLAHSHAPLSLSYDHHLFRFFSRLHFSFRMSWFNKRSERNAIPPVKEEQAPSYRSPAPSYKSAPSVRSAAPSNYPTRDGPTYQSNSGYEQSSYQRSIVPSAAPVDDARANQNRSELFAGYNPQKAQPNRFNEGPSLGREPPPGEENDEDVEGIKKQTRWVKQESVNSTRNALRMAREAEETARGTLGRLGDQSGMFVLLPVDAQKISRLYRETRQH